MILPDPVMDSRFQPANRYACERKLCNLRQPLATDLILTSGSSFPRDLEEGLGLWPFPTKRSPPSCGNYLELAEGKWGGGWRTGMHVQICRDFREGGIDIGLMTRDEGVIKLVETGQLELELKCRGPMVIALRVLIETRLPVDIGSQDI